MGSKPTPTLIQREDAASPSGEAGRRSALERAKQRAAGKVVPGPMEDVSRFDEVRAAGRGMRPAPGAASPPTTLSRATEQSLQAVAAANRPSAQPQESAPPDQTLAQEVHELDVETLANLLRCDARTARRVHELLNPDKESGNFERIRRTIEGRLGMLDIGEFLMNGVLSQRVTIIPPSETSKTGLEVVFQTVTDGVEAHIDRLMSDEAARIRHVRLAEGSDKVVDAEMNQREYVRRQNELSLAVHLRSYMGNAWPALTSANGEVDAAAVQKRLALVRQVPSALMTLVVYNLGWFLERVQETLDVAVLGNG